MAGTQTLAQQWSLDTTGNWAGFQEDTNGDGTWDLDQSRTHNAVNEIMQLAATDEHVAHDCAGNMIRVPRRGNWAGHYDLTYDAWNRLAKVFDVETAVAEYAYDGRDFRTTATSAGTVRHSYHSRKWQALEERVGSSGAADRQFTWGLRYIDDLVLRDRDANGTPPERLYAIQDPNWNVTVLANSSGATQERYAYEAYGKVAFFTDSFGSRRSSGYAWDSLYTGRQYDPEAELYYLRARYFDASLGIFSTRDPIEYRGGINLYAYVGNSPVRRTDPSGLACTVKSICDLTSSSLSSDKCTRDCHYTCREISRVSSAGGTITCDDLPKEKIADLKKDTQNVSLLCKMFGPSCGSPSNCGGRIKDASVYYDPIVNWGDCSRAACRADCDTALKVAKAAAQLMPNPTAKKAAIAAAEAAAVTCRDGCNAYCKKP